MMHMHFPDSHPVFSGTRSTIAAENSDNGSLNTFMRAESEPQTHVRSGGGFRSVACGCARVILLAGSVIT
jgi:hypothetical protein